MRSRYMTALAVVIAVIIGISLCGCKKEEPVREDTAPVESVEEEPQKEEILPKEPVSLEEKLYKQTKIAFPSYRDGNNEIYIMNADGSEQRNLTNNPAHDWIPSWSPFLPSAEEK